jgi:ribonuclease HII
MPPRRSSRRSPLFRNDQPFLRQYVCIAGVDEAGRGPLAGPVVAAAVILPDKCELPGLNDSKKLSVSRRNTLYRLIQRRARAIGVGIIEAGEIDRINIRQASFAAMRQALQQLKITPAHVLVDGFSIPGGPASQTGIIGGDQKSAHIAAASIIAKVTRDAMMIAFDREFPQYGFSRHKGYGTAEHLDALERLGPCPIHRFTFSRVNKKSPSLL